jgi:hypothetical protein
MKKTADYYLCLGFLFAIKTAIGIAMLLMMFSCTETVYVEVPGKTDTLKVERFIDRTFNGTDTVTITQVIEVPTPTRVQDTIIVNVNDTIYVDRIDTVMVDRIVYVDRIDSVFIDRIVYLTDTIAITQTIHFDTLFIQPGRGYHSVPVELEKIVTAFYEDAAGYGLYPYGGLLAITIEDIDAVLPAYSYRTYGQLNIVINKRLTVDQMMLPIYRELSRWQLDKEYSLDQNSVLYQFYPSNKILYSTKGQ